MANWISTFTKKKFYPLEPKVEDIDIEDIAHSLSMLCRFNGHCSNFYSVAEHCVLVANSLPQDLKLWGLLHDAGEAYLSDLPRPIKHKIIGFEEIEDNILKQVMIKYGQPFPMPKEVDQADRSILGIELDHFFNDKENDLIQCLTLNEAKRNFLQKFKELTHKK